MAFTIPLRNPRRYVIKKPIGGYAVHESTTKAVCAVLVRHNLSDAWQVYDVYPSQESAERVQPVRDADEGELNKDDALIRLAGTKRVTRPWNHKAIRPIEGFIKKTEWGDNPEDHLKA